MIEEWVGAELALEGLVERSETHQWNVDGYDGLLLIASTYLMAKMVTNVLVKKITGVTN
jgi:hypothetical protein